MCVCARARVYHAQRERERERERGMIAVQQMSASSGPKYGPNCFSIHIKHTGMIAVQQMSASSGPKYGPNLYDLAHALSPDTILDHDSISDSLSGKANGKGAPRFGFFVDQACASPALLR